MEPVADAAFFRPARSTGALLSRDLIARRAFELAGDEGFPAVTMHRLAREFGVSPRALYSHVENRQDIVDAVGALMMQELPVLHLDASDWQNSLRAAYRDARAAYRKHPRALLIAMDETLTPSLPPQDSDEMFEAFIDLRVAAIETMLDAAKDRSRHGGGSASGRDES